MPTTYPTTPKVESKVKAATGLAYLAGVGALAAVNAIGDAVGNTTLITDLPDWLEVFVAPAVPSLFAFVGGWLAKHTPRPDLTSAER